MSASGKSSNRRSEYNRGRSTGGGHGPYAAQGKADRKRAQRRPKKPETVCEAVAPFKSALVQCDKEPGHKGPHHAEYQGVTLRWGHRR